MQGPICGPHATMHLTATGALKLFFLIAYLMHPGKRGARAAVHAAQGCA